VIKKSSAITHVAPLQKAVTRTVEAAEIRVLVVDDEHVSRAMKVEAMRLGGFDVTEADGIGSALASLQKSPIDVLVLDMQMPNPEGEPGDAGLVVLRAIANSAAKPLSGANVNVPATCTKRITLSLLIS
jgi:CheY-like chemotaxis protein